MAHDPFLIAPTFIQHAADVLADTSLGLSGSDIVKSTSAYAVEYNVDLPFPAQPFGGSNKRTVLYRNLMAFSAAQQYRIIKELCDYRSFTDASSKERQKLKITLMTRYGHLDTESGASKINETLIEETRHWLDGWPEALTLYEGALDKFKHGVFHRNVLDDLRLSLEKLLRAVLANQKSLENQLPLIGAYIKDCGGSKELANMFAKLLDYYASYQNTYVKHDDAVIEEEIEFVFEITSSFMKHLIRLDAKS